METCYMPMLEYCLQSPADPGSRDDCRRSRKTHKSRWHKQYNIEFISMHCNLSCISSQYIECPRKYICLIYKQIVSLVPIKMGGAFGYCIFPSTDSWSMCTTDAVIIVSTTEVQIHCRNCNSFSNIVVGNNKFAELLKFAWEWCFSWKVQPYSFVTS